MSIGMAARAVVISGAVAFGNVWPSQTAAVQNAQLIRLAIELAADREPVPIPLDQGRPGHYGMAYDRFTRAHVSARAASLAGKPHDPLSPPGALLAGQLLIVAVPLTCGERTIRPADVDVFRNASPVPKWLPSRDAALQKLLPGVPLPAGAIGVQFDRASLATGELVRVTYAENICSSSTKRVELPVTASGPRIVERALVEMHPDQPAPPGPIDLTLSGVIDLDGRLRYATAPEATTPFGIAALADDRVTDLDT